MYHSGRLSNKAMDPTPLGPLARPSDGARHRHRVRQTSLKMPVTDVDQEEVVRLLVHDLHATVGAGYDTLALDNASRLRQFIDDVGSYVQRVVDDTQQDMHDEFVDTVWPKCPRHAHPLWFRDGSWWCERDEWCVARLGELKSHDAA
jgi:HrpA-like RNA helicase